VTDHLPADPDRALVAEAAAGGREAFDELVGRHQARIFNLARALVGDDGEADDLTQETFIRVWRALGRFRGDSAFRTWLYRVAINVIRSHLAARSRRRAVWGWWWPDTPGGAKTALDVADATDMERDATRTDRPRAGGASSGPAVGCDLARRRGARIPGDRRRARRAHRHGDVADFEGTGAAAALAGAAAVGRHVRGRTS